MKRVILPALFCLVTLACLSFAANLTDLEKHPTCKYCGMDRSKYAHSRMLIEYDDGTSSGGCSLHCSAVDLANNIDKLPKNISVGDYRTNKLIDAEKAFWVVGGNKAGVMTSNPKWAFGSKEDAEKFIKASGGVPVTFDDAIKAAYEDMYRDTKQIRERRKMKRSPKQ